jgi:hypothetical protein
MSRKRRVSKEHTLLSNIQRQSFENHQHHKCASEMYARRAARLTVVNAFSSIMILFIAANKPMQLFISEMIGKLASAVGFASQYNHEIDLGALAIGILSTVAVCTTALQFFLKYEERHLIHKYVAADLDNICRKIGRFLVKETITDEEIHRINKQLNYTMRHAPFVSSRISEAATAVGALWRRFKKARPIHEGGDLLGAAEPPSMPHLTVLRSAGDSTTLRARRSTRHSTDENSSDGRVL